MEFWDCFFEIAEVIFKIIGVAAVVVTGVICILCVCLLVCLLSPKSHFAIKGNLPKGYYYKQLAIDTLTLTFYNKQMEKTNRLSEDACMIRLLPEINRDITKNKEEAFETFARNVEANKKIQKDFATMLAGEEICFFGWQGYFSPESDMRLYSMDEKMQDWFESHEMLKNGNGEMVAVRGVSQETIEMLWEIGTSYDELFWELVIPDITEKQLLGLDIDSIRKFSYDSYKFKINNGSFDNCYFEFSKVPGYTKEDFIQKARDFAESKGYKFKMVE